jgi:hypothetical protein
MWFENHELEAILQKVIDNFLIHRFNKLGMNASGEWLANLQIEVSDDFGKIRGRDYSEQLAQGRKPGKAPPIRQLEKWVNAKLGVYGPEATSIAFAISKKIAKEGTTWYQKGGTDLIEVLSEPKTIQFIQEQLSAILTVRVAERLQRETQQAFSIL